MTTKTDPYATKLHKRVDALLFVIVVLLVAFFLRTSARGEAILSVAPQPFWTTLHLLKAEPTVSMIFVAPSFLGESQPNYAAANGADLSALMGTSASSGFTPIMMMPEKSRPQGAQASNVDPGYGHKAFASQNSSLADNWSQGAGVGSTIPAFRTGYATSRDDSVGAPAKSHQAKTIAAAVDDAPRYAGEASFSADSPSRASNDQRALSIDSNTSLFSAKAETSHVSTAQTTSSASSFGLSSATVHFPKFIAELTSTLDLTNSAAADLYWRTDGATGGTWTGSNWSNPATPTGGTSWLSGDDAFFTANSTLTFVTATLFADVTLSPNITVTITMAGTASAGAHTYDIGSGSTLTWISQNFTATGTSFVKDGLGTWNIGAISNAYTGGFTLNTGTVIVSGDNSLGGASAPLTINGGTIQSSGTRSFSPTSITIGGDFELTGTGASTWTGSVNLGGSTRTITNNAVGSGVSRIFSGIISGASGAGLTIVGTGTGVLNSTSTTILSGGNSYSGGTTLNGGGILQLSGSGTLGSPSGALTVNAGRLDLNGTSQTVGALNGGGGTINTSTGTSTLTVGNGGGSGSYSGVIGGGTGTSLVKLGNGIQTLTGANTYTGTTTINGGTLRIDSAGSTTPRLAGTSGITVNSGGTLLLANSTSTTSTNRISDTATLTLAGGTFNLGARSEGAAGTTGIGALTLTSNSTFDFGTLGTSNLIQFAGVGAHTSGALFQIIDWEGTAGSAGGSDRLLFAGISTSFMGLYSQSDVSFNGFTGYGLADFGSYYEVYGLTAVPEPSTWVAGALALLAVGYTQRRRFGQKAILASVA